MLFLSVISLIFQQLTSDEMAHVLHTEKSQSQTWTSIVAMILGQSYLLNNKQRTQVWIYGQFKAKTWHTLLPSTLARGFEWGIYSHNVRTYVSVTLRNVNLRSHAHRGTHASRALTHEYTGCTYCSTTLDHLASALIKYTILSTMVIGIHTEHSLYTCFCPVKYIHTVKYCGCLTCMLRAGCYIAWQGCSHQTGLTGTNQTNQTGDYSPGWLIFLC